MKWKSFVTDWKVINLLVKLLKHMIVIKRLRVSSHQPKLPKTHLKKRKMTISLATAQDQAAPPVDQPACQAATACGTLPLMVYIYQLLGFLFHQTSPTTPPPSLVLLLFQTPKSCWTFWTGWESPVWTLWCRDGVWGRRFSVIIVYRLNKYE